MSPVIRRGCRRSSGGDVAVVQAGLSTFFRRGCRRCSGGAVAGDQAGCRRCSGGAVAGDQAGLAVSRHVLRLGINQKGC